MTLVYALAQGRRRTPASEGKLKGITFGVDIWIWRDYISAMTKHTPGPWTVKGGANDANVFYDAEGRAVGTAYFRENEAEMHANRALLAAAPDLLAALILVYNALATSVERPGDIEIAALDAGEAAIRKAGGE